MPDKQQENNNFNNNSAAHNMPWYKKTNNYYLEFCIMFFLLVIISIAIPIGIYSSFKSLSGAGYSWQGSLWAGSILLPVAFIFTPLYLRTRMDEAFNEDKQKNVLKLIFVIMFSIVTIITALILVSNSIYSLGYAIKDSSFNRFLSSALPAFLTSLSLAFLTISVAKKSKPASTAIFTTMLFVLIFGFGLFSVIVGIGSGEPRNKDCQSGYTFSESQDKCVYNYNNYDY